MPEASRQRGRAEAALLGEQRFHALAGPGGGSASRGATVRPSRAADCSSAADCAKRGGPLLRGAGSVAKERGVRLDFAVDLRPGRIGHAVRAAVEGGALAVDLCAQAARQVVEACEEDQDDRQR